MSATAVQSQILEPMQQLYTPRRDMPKADQAGALRQYVTVLERYDAEDLAAAWRSVVETHPHGTWPVPAVFAVAARKAANDRAGTPKATRHGSGENEQGSHERWERWKAICRTPLAAQSVEMNVAWSLKCAVLHDGKTPDQINLKALAAGKRSAERTAEKIRNDQPLERNGRNIGVMKPELANRALGMWEQILQREVETQAEIRSAQRAVGQHTHAAE